MIMLSVIIPAYKEPYLQKTIDSLLENSEGELEIIVVLDAYWPVPPLTDNPRVRILHLGRNRGMRGAINAGIAISRGEFFMRLDSHCMFAKGYDVALTSACKPNEIMTARRYFLDPIKWEVMDLPYVDYEKLVIQEDKKFSGQRWTTRDEERKNVLIDETMAMQGSMWIMPRKWFDEVCGGELQEEGYGPAYQDSTEVMVKTWKAGGRVMLNKTTWFAHKHRSFARSHQEGTVENPWNREASWKYSLDLHRDYYEKVLVPKWFK